MAIHHIECAGALALPASTKLVLMAFADSADRQTRMAFPGLDQVLQWSGLNRSRCFEVVRDLRERGLLVQVKGGRRGQRAEYLVFPGGCCREHGPLPGYEAVDRPLELGSGGADPNEPVDNLGSGAELGSGGADPNGGKGPVRVRLGSGPGRTPPQLPNLLTPPPVGNPEVVARVRESQGGEGIEPDQERRLAPTGAAASAEGSLSVAAEPYADQGPGHTTDGYYAAVLAARRRSGQTAQGWTEPACWQAVDATAQAHHCSQDEAWAALAAVAAADGTLLPGRLPHQAAPHIAAQRAAERAAAAERVDAKAAEERARQASAADKDRRRREAKLQPLTRLPDAETRVEAAAAALRQERAEAGGPQIVGRREAEDRALAEVLAERNGRERADEVLPQPSAAARQEA